jgi:cytochrome c oxidase subunit 2
MTSLRPSRELLVLLALLIGPSASVVAEDTPELQGRKLFLKLQCIKCHNATADAKAPNLEALFGKKVKLDSGKTVTVDEAYIVESIRKPKAKVVEGWEPIMPAYDEKKVSDEEVKALVAFIKSLKPGDTPKEKQKEKEKPKEPTPPREK